jgi:hypothetical protein
MHGLHPEQGASAIVIALILEVLFIGFCVILVGTGTSEIRKGKPFFKNLVLVLMGSVLAALSLYITKLFLEG